MIFDTLPKSTASPTELKALRMAFMILSKENLSLDPSRLVMVKFFISILMIGYIFWETYSVFRIKKFSILDKLSSLYFV